MIGVVEIAEAAVADVYEIHRIRLAVKENILGDPSKVCPADSIRMIEQDGKGWVGRVDGAIRGFSFADRTTANIWALFIEPGYDGRGMGRRLHDLAVAWLFEQGATRIWLTTAPGTRAERLYRRAGWVQTGVEPNADIRLELGPGQWRRD